MLGGDGSRSPPFPAPLRCILKKFGGGRGRAALCSSKIPSRLACEALVLPALRSVFGFLPHDFCSCRVDGVGFWEIGIRFSGGLYAFFPVVFSGERFDRFGGLGGMFGELGCGVEEVGGWGEV